MTSAGFFQQREEKRKKTAFVPAKREDWRLWKGMQQDRDIQNADFQRKDSKAGD